MRRLYEKNELTFAIAWIVVYCVLQSLANLLNEKIGIEYSASAIFCILQSVLLLVFIQKNNLLERYGLCKSAVPARCFFYYVPLFILATGITFGMGHLLNLFNGSGMDLANNLCQICFAVAVGFLFVTIFYRGGSLLPCIFTHSAINALSTFANEAGFTMEKQIMRILIMIALTVAYALILTKTLPKIFGFMGYFYEKI